MTSSLSPSLLDNPQLKPFIETLGREKLTINGIDSDSGISCYVRGMIDGKPGGLKVEILTLPDQSVNVSVFKNGAQLITPQPRNPKMQQPEKTPQEWFEYFIELKDAIAPLASERNFDPDKS